MSDPQTTLRWRILKVSLITIGVFLIFLVFVVEVNIIQEWLRDYRASIVRDTVEALRRQ